MTTLQHARHLLQRTGFAESPEAVRSASDTSLSEFVDSLLKNSEPISPQLPPAWVYEPPVNLNMKLMNEVDKRSARKEIRNLQNTQINELRIWWLTSLINTKNPLKARMTLFWQNHFTSQFRKVRRPSLMYRQHEKLIRQATGNFGSILSEILRDPAMLIYLDNRVNQRNKPNENLARELLELFTLGEGNYSEQDVRELAKALTGLSINKNFDFVFKRKLHDDGEKNLFGERGNFALDDVIELILTHPATAINLTNKLWKHFISDTPDSLLVEEWARIYREFNYDTKVLLRLMFTSSAFTDVANHGQLVKSPVEYIVGMHRVLNIPPIDGKSLLRASKSMQQILYAPPNVRGWVGGAQWINSETLLARRRFVGTLFRQDGLKLESLQADLSNEEISSSLLPLQISSDESSNKKMHAIEQALRSPAFNLS